MADKAYAKAGVDVTAGYELVARIKKHAARTARLGAMGALGGFGGAFDLSAVMKARDIAEPVLVSGTDGVGTKLLLAQQTGRHGTIGQDVVAMCVNDVVAAGAAPLYFLDYIATGKNDPAILEQVVAGVADGCKAADCALIGGETAEMPDLYGAQEYDLAGFAVGLADKSQLIDGARDVAAGDVLLGLASSGIHSNGYSLLRRIFEDADLTATLPELDGQSLIDALLEPTRIYVKPVLPLIEQGLLHGIAHITGGGFLENIPRTFGNSVTAEIDKGSWPIPPIFQAIERVGQIPHAEMYEIFNMGIGMVLIASPEQAAAVAAQTGAVTIGRVIPRGGRAAVVIA